MSKRKKEELEGYDFYDDIDELDRASNAKAKANANKSRTIRKRRTNTKRVTFPLALLISLLIILIVGFSAYVAFRVDVIEYEGNTHYSDEEMSDFLFEGKTPNSLIYFLFGNTNIEIPFIQKYDVEIKWPNKFYVTVYEKPIIGYVKYMGSYMYFDKDGIVVESSTELIDSVPEVQGLEYSSIVLNKKIEVADESIFDKILELAQGFDKYDLDVDSIFFDSEGNIYVYIGSVKVAMGNTDDYSERLFELKQLYSKLNGMSGTLYLDEFDGSQSSIIFKKDN
ncbi:cell division protein FtsQ/DivIB [Lachnospira pectinoschiza]|uniref:Cell division protein FtsQ n=1 Tax=Lachnospira pectinoschiza TaxID=28052 RepID=A0A1G9Z522_9FIRM|nr:hypothetical protein [Lachnospira pectinoschiza]SDN15696.1 cell division protein FtsQ [Lachnospira pectinoschiza]